MTCARYRHLLSRYLDGEVTPRQRMELLEHVDGCRDCAAWLARARQTDVLLKEVVHEARPSDHVRDAILRSVKQQSTHAVRPASFHTQDLKSNQVAHRTHHSAFHRWSLMAAGLLLRFDPSPRRIALVAATSMFALVGLAYWINILPPFGGYKELGFIVPGEDAPLAVNSTPLAAVSSGEYGVGGVVAVPNMVRQVPANSAHDVPLGAPMSVRFDQPMDRASVEKSWGVDPPAAGAFTWNADNEVSFSAYDPGLLRGITYTVLLSNTARSLTGTPLKQPISWSFHTKDPYTVIPGVDSGATLYPTATLSLLFESPMSREQTLISLHADGSGEDLPATLHWDPGMRQVTIEPGAPLPEGTVYLRVGTLSRTQTGYTLGEAHEFAYNVALPGARLRFLGGRTDLVSVGSAQTRSYDVGESSGTTTLTGMPGYIPDEDPGTGPAVTFSLYRLPAEYLSALGAEKRLWPLALPQGLPLDTVPVKTFWSNSKGTKNNTGEVTLPDDLRAGTYILVGSRLASAAIVTDWQMLVVSNSHLATVGAGSSDPLWATDAQGSPWSGSEVSLYSPDGMLLEKGLTDDHGLWTSSSPRQNATLAVARDGAGHLAALRLDPTASPLQGPSGSLVAEMQTDRVEYYPGQTANFHVLVNITAGATPVGEQGVSVKLLSPSGDAVSSLTLKLDDVGGASGSFLLPVDLKPGGYSLLIGSGGLERSFPLPVRQPKSNTLSVYIVPEAPEDTLTRVVTRTLSVLGPKGIPAAGATVTMTLGITGDAWVSEPVTTTTDVDGNATVALTLPTWIASYNDPGLYVAANVSLDGLSGADSQYLDLTSEAVTITGRKQVVSTALNLAAVAQPTADGVVNLRVVTLDSAGAGGNVLMTAQSPSGESGVWSLDLSEAGDLTVILPPQYAGGQMRLQRSGVAGAREMALMPANGGELHLQMTAPFYVVANAPLSLTVGLIDKDSQPLAGAATVWFRRVASSDWNGSDAQVGESLGWEPDIALSAKGPLTLTVQAPGAPGLWYIISRAATAGGGRAQTWSVIRVLPGPSVQLPPALQTDAMVSQAFSIRVHNPLSETLSAAITLGGDSALNALGGNSQSVFVAPGTSQRLDWRVQPTGPGNYTAIFGFAPDHGLIGSWNFNVSAVESAHTNITYLSGVSSGDKSVGILVPSDLSTDRLELQVRASTSLLITLSGIASNLTDNSLSGSVKAAAGAARLGSSAALNLAYSQVGTQAPANLVTAKEEIVHLLQDIYSAQLANGSWSADNSSKDVLGSITGTAHILLALQRYNLLSQQDAGAEAPIHPDTDVIKRGLHYLALEVERPLGALPSQSLLDERAYGLFALSQFGLLQAEVVRPYIVYTSSKSAGLSGTGDAWLALALLQSGSIPDGLLLVDRLLANAPKETDASAPMLAALLLADRLSVQEEALSHTKSVSAYAKAAPSYVRVLMEQREGLGWGTYGGTGDALWALSSYQGQASEKPAKILPDLTLNDRPVQVTGGSDSDTLSLSISGSEMHAGTNWLKLKAPAQGQSLYYSLTLKATR